MRTAVVRVLVIAVATMFSLAASAAPIGVLNFTIPGARVGSNFIDFFPFELPPPAFVPDTGEVNVSPPPPTTGDFLTVVDPTRDDEGRIKDLTTTIAPVGVPFFLPDFLTFVGPNPLGIAFDLTFIPAGDVGPFTFSESPAGVGVLFEVRGIARDNVSSIPFVGFFTTQFRGTTAQLLAQLPPGDPNAFIQQNNSISATFFVIPEPGTLSIMLIGAGLIGLAAIRRHYSKQ